MPKSTVSDCLCEAYVCKMLTIAECHTSSTMPLPGSSVTVMIKLDSAGMTPDPLDHAFMWQLMTALVAIGELPVTADDGQPHQQVCCQLRQQYVKSGNGMQIYDRTGGHWQAACHSSRSAMPQQASGLPFAHQDCMCTSPVPQDAPHFSVTAAAAHWAVICSDEGVQCACRCCRWRPALWASWRA